jgi:hypothetical protein
MKKAMDIYAKPQPSKMNIITERFVSAKADIP